MPFISSVHIDTALTNLSVAYTQLGLAGDRVFPVAPVDKRSDRWFVYGTQAFLTTDDLVRPGTYPQEVRYTVTQSSYSAERHAQRELVTDAERRLADLPLQPEMDATEIVTQRVQNNREKAQATVATDPTQLTQNTALSGTSQWSDYTNSTPLVNIRAARSAVRLGVAQRANTLTLGYDVALVLADHPSVKDLIKYTNPGNISDSGLPNVIRGLEVVEAASVIASANEGQTQAFGSIWGKNAIVHYTNPSVGLKKISLGYTLEAPDDTTGARGYAVRKYREDGLAGDWVEVNNTYTVIVVAPLAAQLFTTAVS